jgi:hypothetical protein
MELIRGYKYVLEKEPGKDFDPRFKPFNTRQEILTICFREKYINHYTYEFPKECFLWSHGLAKLSQKT